jgi:hypothetical protein
MKHIVFYSWQSDLEGALTRNFIEEALTRAADSLNKDQTTTVDPVVDRDTGGKAGAVDIADTIFQKIRECDAFVCDVSFINGRDPGSLHWLPRLLLAVLEFFNKGYFRQRLTPNPNVMAEIGFAAASVGWNRIILVLNTAFGEVENLPFDLRGRSVVTFDLPSREARRELRPQFKAQIEAALRHALKEIIQPEFWINKNKPRWFGYWHSAMTIASSKMLLIREVGVAGFNFHMWLVDGARTGLLSGFARFVGPESAHAFIYSSPEERPCEVKFRRTNRKIMIEQSLDCQTYMGLGATFDGEYICDQDLLFDSDRLEEMDLQRLYGITGSHYRKLLESFQQLGEADNKDSFVAMASVGGIRGLYTICEGIVMKAESGHLWAAFIDGDVVRYFTTHPNYKAVVPRTIDHWRAGFADKEILIENDVSAFPSFI